MVPVHQGMPEHVSRIFVQCPYLQDRWTFEVAGMDLTKFMETGAAYVHQKALPQDSGHCAWPTNYQKLASATMFTLFFGGDIFAPKALYNGEPVQQFLQRHFCAAYNHLAT